MMWLSILAILIGYVVGSISPSYIIGRLVKHVDIRKYGTKNAGTSNAFRTIGFAAGMTTLAFDLGKGALSMLFAHLLGAQFLVLCLTGFAAILGHDFPFYMQFRGGKGAATAWGVIVALIAIFAVQNKFPLEAYIPVFAVSLIALSLIAITKSANLSGFISFPLFMASFLALKISPASIAIALFFLYIIAVSITTIAERKGIKNDMKFAKGNKEIVVWRKSLRFLFLVFPLLYFWLDGKIIMIALAALALIFLIFDLTKIKRNAVIRHLYKKSEMKAKISGITLFLIGALITVLFFQKNIAIMAMVFATIGDNFAVLLGVPFGRHRILKGKSIEGFLACLASSALAGIALMHFLGISIFVVAGGAIASAIAELLSGDYDNVVMAPLAALAMSVIKF